MYFGADNRFDWIGQFWILFFQDLIDRFYWLTKLTDP